MIEANKIATEISTPGQFRCEVEGQLQGRASEDRLACVPMGAAATPVSRLQQEAREGTRTRAAGLLHVMMMMLVFIPGTKWFWAEILLVGCI